MSDTASTCIADKTQLKPSEVILLLKLSHDGLTQTEIAHRLGCHQSTVSRILSDYEDTRDLAKRRLHNGAKALAERVIKDANVEESLEVLDRLGVAEKRREQHISMTAIAIDASTPLQLPTIPGNIIANYQTQTLDGSTDSLCKPALTEGESVSGDN